MIHRNRTGPASTCDLRAQIHTINGLSAHADPAELLAWQRKAQARQIFIVHGEEETLRGLSSRLVDALLEIPALKETFEL